MLRIRDTGVKFRPHIQLKELFNTTNLFNHTEVCYLCLFPVYTPNSIEAVSSNELSQNAIMDGVCVLSFIGVWPGAVWCRAGWSRGLVTGSHGSAKVCSVWGAETCWLGATVDFLTGVVCHPKNHHIIKNIMSWKGGKKGQHDLAANSPKHPNLINILRVVVCACKSV